MILLIGGLGFIGMHTTRALLDAGESVVATWFSTRRMPEFLEGEVGKRLFPERMDVSKTFEVFDVVGKHKVDSIIDLMAPPAVGASPHYDYHMYTTGLQNVLEAARTFGLKRVSLGSSGSVYSGLLEGPYHEDMLPHRLQFEALHAHGVHPRRVITTSSADAILGFVESGVGYSLVPSLSESGPKSRGLIARPLTTPKIDFPVVCAWRKDAPENPLLDVALECAP